MNVEIFTVCKRARIESGEEMHISVPFDKLTAKGFPGSAEFSVAMRVRISAPFPPTREFGFVLVDDDGKPVAEKIACDVGLGPSNAISRAVNLCVNYKVRFEKPGSYQMDLSADDVTIASVPLFVRQASRYGINLE